MNKQITIYDYAHEPVAITIENFENVKSISCEVRSGDEILHVKYNDNTTKTFDSSTTRLHGYYDGEVNIPLEKLDDISTIPDSYTMLEHFGDENAKVRVTFEAMADLAELAKKGK